MAATAMDVASIHSLVSQTVNDKLEVAVIYEVANAMEDNKDDTLMSTSSSSSGVSTFHSAISQSGNKCMAQAGNVGNFFSNKMLQISFKSNK